MMTYVNKADWRCTGANSTRPGGNPENVSRFPVDTFNPESLDTDQWVKTAASFNAKYYVLVADHFSGFTMYVRTSFIVCTPLSACPGTSVYRFPGTTLL